MFEKNLEDILDGQNNNNFESKQVRKPFKYKSGVANGDGLVTL